jgi:hypothetical protein
MTKPDLRNAGLAVVKALFHRVFLTVFVVAGLYIAVCVAVIAKFDLWEWGNLKTTLVWAFGFALVTIFDANRIDEDRTYFGKTLRDTINVTVLIVFLMEMQSFSLVVELILVPIIAFIGLLHAVSDTKPEHAAVTRLLTWVLGLIAIFYLAYSVSRTVQGWSDFDGIMAARELIVPIILSLLFLPFLYGLSVYMVYEQVFAGLAWKLDNDALSRFARRSALWAFRLNLPLLKRWRHIVMHQSPKERGAVTSTINQAKREHSLHRSPPAVRPEDGWSPYLAMRFLESFGLEMQGYYWYHDRYRANSNHLKLDKGLLSNSVTFHVEGSEHAATELTLELNIRQTANGETDEAVFANLCFHLLHKAIGLSAANMLSESLIADDVSFEIDGYRVRLGRETWETTGDYEHTLVIEHPRNSTNRYDW